MLGPLRPILRPLPFIGVLGLALTGLARVDFLLRFDDSRPLQQGFSFCRMLLAPLGPALYRLLVYSRSEVLRSRVERVREA